MDDLISRKQALQELDNIENKDCWYRLTDIMKMLNRLPSIQPEQGITIPDNATNSDVIKALFPNGVPKDVIWTLSFDKCLDWWNAPYKREEE